MKKIALALLAVLLLPAVAGATNYRFAALNRSFTDGSRPVWAFWLCDTEAGMPTVGLFEGDLGYAVDTNALFYWDGSSWTPVDAGGAGSGLSHAQVMTRLSLGGGF